MAAEHSDGSIGARPSNAGSTDRRLPLAPIVAFVALWLGGPWLIVGAWLRPLLPGGWLAVAGGLALLALPVWVLLRGLRGRSYPGAAARRWLFRPFWYAMLWLPPLATATLAGGLLGLPFEASGPVGRWTLAAATAALLIVALVGYAGSRRLVVRRLEVRMPRLPEAFDGLRVVQISDLHVGPHTPRRFLGRIAAAVEREAPDLIAVTGDQVDDFPRDVEPFGAAFGGLKAPLGMIVVPGNHDVYAGWEPVRQGLVGLGLTVLVNQAVPVERHGQRLWIAGTGDPAATIRLGDGRGPAPDIERTLAGIPPHEPIVALAHNPALWPALARRGVDLTLSGHTHYGQLAIRRWNWCLATPFVRLAMGRHRAGRSLLYINPGTNYWGVPLRIGTPPEVTSLTLRSRAGCEAEIVTA